MRHFSSDGSLLLLLAGLLSLQTCYALGQEEAVRGLIQRLLPYRHEEFQFELVGLLDETERLSFKVLKTTDDKYVKISGSSGVSIAWGLHYYLRYYCNCHISWDGDQLTLPDVLPNADIEVVSDDRYRYYQNVCTFGYSSAWWDWPRWEREIDWMALQGINLPLAFIGQEAIFKRVYKNLGLTDAEIDDHFVGPGFLPWGRMGNIRGWGGPLSDSWHNRTMALQHKILDRMRSFGMKPVLPAFAGFVPRNITRVFPNATVSRVERWCNFKDKYCCPSFLDPDDPLFAQIGEAFIGEMIKEWGTDHMYNCDMFNEIRPTNSSAEYIRSVGQSVFAGMRFADSGAQWVMQGWLFIDRDFWTRERAEALLTSVPIGKMIVLDLNSDGSPFYNKYDSYFGQPFIWNTLHNFGGTLGMYGYIDVIGMGIDQARSWTNTTLLGTGLTMEGINQNYIVYDYTLDMGYRKAAPDSVSWIRNYTIQRYRRDNENIQRAWKFLKIFYNIEDVILAWDDLYEVAGIFRDVPTFMHDLIDVSRQVLQDIFSLQYLFVVHAFKLGKVTELQRSSKTLIDILEDMEKLLNTNSAFMLGPWLESAKAAAGPDEEEVQFEYNARNQITLWGPRGEISDYAAKQWGGMIKDYYIPRWQRFVANLTDCLLNNKTFDKSSFDQDVFKNVEVPFTHSRNIYPTEPSASVWDVLPNVYETWRSFYNSEASSFRQVVEQLKRKKQSRKKYSNPKKKGRSKKP